MVSACLTTGRPLLAAGAWAGWADSIVLLQLPADYAACRCPAAAVDRDCLACATRLHYLLLVLDLCDCVLAPVHLRGQVVCVQAAVAEAGQLVALAHKLAIAQGILLLVLLVCEVSQGVEAQLQPDRKQDRSSWRTRLARATLLHQTRMGSC